MESKKNYKGLKRYETILKTICSVENYYDPNTNELLSLWSDQLNDNEWEGCLGIACVISVVEGVIPNMFSISKHLDIPHYNIHLQRAFERLKVNGILSKRYGAMYDPSLTGMANDAHWMTGTGREVVQTGSEVERNAWCTIAGIASGYIGMRETEKSDELLQSESIEV